MRSEKERQLPDVKHLPHFIKALDGRDMAKQLTLLLLEDVDDMEKTRHAVNACILSTYGDSSKQGIDGIEQIPPAISFSTRSGIIEIGLRSAGDPH